MCNFWFDVFFELISVKVITRDEVAHFYLSLSIIISKSLHKSRVAHQAGAYPGFCSMKRLRVFLLPPGWDTSPSQGQTPSIKFAGTHLHTWVERRTVRVKFLAQEHNTMSPSRARAWGPFLEDPGKFSHPESRRKISKLMITELFYSRILNIYRGCLHNRSFRCIHFSVFRHR